MEVASPWHILAVWSCSRSGPPPAALHASPLPAQEWQARVLLPVNAVLALRGARMNRCSSTDVSLRPCPRCSAVDNILLKLRSDCATVPFVRLGREASVHPDILPFMPGGGGVEASAGRCHAPLPEPRQGRVGSMRELSDICSRRFVTAWTSFACAVTAILPSKLPQLCHSGCAMAWSPANSRALGQREALITLPKQLLQHPWNAGHGPGRAGLLPRH